MRMELLNAWDVVDAIKQKGHTVSLVEVGGLTNPETVWRCAIDKNIIAEAPTSIDAVLEALQWV